MNDVLEGKTRHLELLDMEVKTCKDLLYLMHREKMKLEFDLTGLSGSLRHL
jgi:hypothetical protein